MDMCNTEMLAAIHVFGVMTGAKSVNILKFYAKKYILIYSFKIFSYIFLTLELTTFRQFLKCFSYSVHFCCFDKIFQIKSILGNKEIYFSLENKTTVSHHMESQVRNFKCLVTLNPWSKAQRNKCTLTCLLACAQLDISTLT